MAQPVNFNFLTRPQVPEGSPATPPVISPPSRIPELREQLAYFKNRCESSGYSGNANYETPLPPPECAAIISIEREIDLEQERLDDFKLKGLAKPSPLSSKADGLKAPVEYRLGLDRVAEFGIEDWAALPVRVVGAAISVPVGVGLFVAGAGLAIGDVVFSEIENVVSTPAPPVRITSEDFTNFVSGIRFENAPPPQPERSNAEIEALLLAAPVRPRMRQPSSFSNFSGTAITQE